MIAHAINDDTTQQQVAQKVLATLESANKDLGRFIKKTDGVYTKKRYSEIRKQVKEVANKLQQQINEDIDVDGFLQNELNQLGEIYEGVGISQFKIPTLEQVKSVSTFIPYTDNANFDSFLENVNNQFFNIWDSAVRTGYMTGMPTKDIVRNVVGAVAKDAQVAKSGTIETLRNSLLANTRTALQSFAVETRNISYRKNSDLFDGYKWLGTLDRRSCLVCGALDGRLFNSLEEIAESKDAGMPPLHLNCRCVILPYIKDFEDMEVERASADGYVDDKVTFSDWLREQPEEVQKEVLGKIRYEKWSQDKSLDVGDFVNNGKVIPLNKLNVDENIYEGYFASKKKS